MEADNDLIANALMGAKGFAQGAWNNIKGLGIQAAYANPLTIMGAQLAEPLSQTVADNNPFLGAYNLGNQIGGAIMDKQKRENLLNALKNSFANVATPQGAGQLAGSMVNPLSLGSALFRGPMSEMTAYHGSPHDFDKFDMGKIGTGEGAQSYGHGLYFAENPKVANSYRSMLSGDVTVSGNKPKGFEQEAMANFYKNRIIAGLPSQKARDQTKNWAASHFQIGPDKAAEIAPNLAHKEGALYHVDIPDEHIENMLDWDKPLSQQHENVQRSLMNLPNAHKLQPDMTGAQLYESQLLAPGEFNDPETASKNLRKLGIPGIKYLDQGSRSDGTGTRNFVLFDDSIPKIIKKE